MNEKPDADFQVTKEQRADSGLSASFGSLKILIAAFVIGISRRVGKIYPLPPEVDFEVTKDQSQDIAVSTTVPALLAVTIATVIGVSDSFFQGINQLVAEAVVGTVDEISLIKELSEVLTSVFAVRGRTNYGLRRIFLELSGGIETVQDAMVFKSLESIITPEGKSNFLPTHGISQIVGVRSTVDTVGDFIRSFVERITVRSDTPFTPALFLNRSIGVLDRYTWTASNLIESTVAVVEDLTPIHIFVQTLSQIVALLDQDRRVASFFRTAKETIVSTDEVRQGPHKRLNQSLALIHERASATDYLRELSEVVSTFNLFQYYYRRTILEDIIIEGVESNKPFTVLREIISVTDILIRKIAKSLSEDVALFNIFDYLYNQIIIEAVGGLENVRDVRVFKHLNSTISQSTTTHFSPTKQVSKVVGIVDDIFLPIGEQVRLEEVVGTVTTFTRFGDFIRSFSESTAIHTVTRFTPIKVLGSTVAWVVEVPRRIETFFTSLIGIESERVSLIGKIKEVTSGVVTRFEENPVKIIPHVIGTESLLRKSIRRGFAESIGVLDTHTPIPMKYSEEVVSATHTHAYGITKPVEQRVALFENRIQGVVKDVDSTIAVSESVDKLTSPEVVQTVGVEDVERPLPHKVLSEAVNMVVTRSSFPRRIINQVVGEVMEHLFNARRVVFEDIGIDLEKVTFPRKSVSEIVEIVDTFGLGRIRALAETVGTSKTVTFGVTKVQSLTIGFRDNLRNIFEVFVAFDVQTGIRHRTPFRSVKVVDETVSTINLIDNIVEKGRRIAQRGSNFVQSLIEPHIIDILNPRNGVTITGYSYNQTTVTMRKNDINIEGRVQNDHTTSDRRNSVTVLNPNNES